ncbi:MAG: phosphotransferase [Nocardioidaceae bacterium]
MGEDRLAGVRTPYDQMPQAVKDFVEAELGSPVVQVTPRTGGMSPAVACSLRSARGRTAFVKAVGTEVHPDTPSHFRHEIAVLQALPAAPYRAGLLAAYDDGDWVGVLLEDIDGRHPDWSSAADWDAVFAAIRLQAAELTPPLPGLPTVSNRDGIEKYLHYATEATELEVASLPVWARRDLDSLLGLVRNCLDHQRDEAFCHWDIRHDNILLGYDGQPVLLDWGMSRRAQRWGDTMCFGLEWVESALFDELVASVDLSPQEQSDVTGFLVGLGLYGLMMSTQPPHPSLPHLPAFRRDLGQRCLAGVRRRIDLGLA